MPYRVAGHLFLSFLLVSLGCGGTSPTAPSPAPAPTATPAPHIPPLPAPPGCSPWPDALGDMLARLTVPESLCLIRANSGGSSEYRPRTRRVIYNSPSPCGDCDGELDAIAHEICHAHQHRAILDAGIPDINVPDEGDWMVSRWMTTTEGGEYLQAGGWVFLGLGGACTRTPQEECWNKTSCEMELCRQANPVEDNAVFCAMWYNPGNSSRWSRPKLISNAPRRSAWAMKWLP